MIPEAFLDCVFYLYPSRIAAEEGHAVGGSGFFVGVPSARFSDRVYVYAVTNRHVVEDGESRTIRINRRAGGVEVFETELNHWTCAAADDLAVVHFEANLIECSYTWLEVQQFVTKELITRMRIGPGDQVFMVGRFVNHQGLACNTPAARFGNLSMMPGEPVKRKDGSLQLSFMADMRSMSGYSGSPVSVFISPAEQPFRRMDRSHPDSRLCGPWLLGIDWGHTESKSRVFTGANMQAEGLHVNTNAGISLIVPAWRLQELLYEDSLVTQRKKMDELRDDIS